MINTLFLTQIEERHNKRLENINCSINELKNKIEYENESYFIVSSNIFEIENNLNKVGLTISKVSYTHGVISVSAIKFNGKFKFIKSHTQTTYNKETGIKVMKLSVKLKENLPSLSHVRVNPYSLEYDSNEELEGKCVLIEYWFK